MKCRLAADAESPGAGIRSNLEKGGRGQRGGGGRRQVDVSNTALGDPAGSAPGAERDHEGADSLIEMEVRGNEACRSGCEAEERRPRRRVRFQIPVTRYARG